MKLTYWDRRPGFFVDPKLGNPLNVPWSGTIFDWYQTLLHAINRIIIDDTHDEKSSINILTSWDVNVILEILPEYQIAARLIYINHDSTFLNRAEYVGNLGINKKIYRDRSCQTDRIYIYSFNELIGTIVVKGL